MYSKVEEGETDPMLKGDDEQQLASSSRLLRNFLTMCIAFSTNHGCVVSCLAYASTQLGNDLGGYGSGCLYVFYALTAFFLSKPVVSIVGPKNGLLLGVSGYCVYVGGFLFAILVPSLAWPVFLVSASIGGIAGGLLWTSQGRYFAKNASEYAKDTGLSPEQVNATFAGYFASLYLGLETITKVLATLIFLFHKDSAPSIIFTSYAVLAFLSCFIMISISDLAEEKKEANCSTIKANVEAIAIQLYVDPKLTLMLPFQIAFGFASSFVPYYVFGTVIADSDNLGGTWVGLLSAIIVLTGASMSMPSSWLANKFGKSFVMTVGGICLSFAGFAFFVFTDEQLGTWSMIVPFLIIYGIGRGTWENTNKAVIADFYLQQPDISTTAFAAISFANGLAGSIGYFTFTDMNRYEI